MAISRSSPGIPTAGSLDMSGSDATSVASAASQGTPGSWTELIASTTRRGSYLVISMGHGGTNISTEVEFGFGTTAKFSIILKSYNQHAAFRGAVPFSIPAGTQLQARCTNHSSAAAQTVNVHVEVMG